MLIKLVGIHDDREVPNVSIFETRDISITNSAVDITDEDPYSSLIDISFGLPGIERGYSIDVRLGSVKQHWVEIQEMLTRLRLENELCATDIQTTIVWNYKHLTILEISDTIEVTAAEKTVDTKHGIDDGWSEDDDDPIEIDVDEEATAREFFNRHISEETRVQLNDAIQHSIAAMNELGTRLKEFMDAYKPTLK